MYQVATSIIALSILFFLVCFVPRAPVITVFILTLLVLGIVNVLSYQKKRRAKTRVVLRETDDEAKEKSTEEGKNPVDTVNKISTEQFARQTHPNFDTVSRPDTYAGFNQGLGLKQQDSSFKLSGPTMHIP